MKELEKLEKIYIDELDHIKNLENKSLNDKENYKKTQRRLRELHRVMIRIKEMK